MKYGTLMMKLKRSYAERIGVSASSLRFIFNVHRIDDGETPEILRMEEDDVIEVYQVKEWRKL